MKTGFAGHIVWTSLQAITRTSDAHTKPALAVQKYSHGRRSAWSIGKRLARKSNVPSGHVDVGIGAFSAQPAGRKFSGENLAMEEMAGSLGSCQTSVRVTWAPEASSPLAMSGLRGKVGSRATS